MKGFLAKAKKTFNQTPSSVTNESHTVSNLILPHSALKPKDIVPPVPHPSPHEHIALLASDDGILLRPHKIHRQQAFLRIPWGSTVKVEEISNDEDAAEEWSKSAVVYGIIGVLELFSGPYLLVITSRLEVGHVLNPLHTVYRIKSASAIPLFNQGQARTIINQLASRNGTLSRQSLIPSLTTDTIMSTPSLSSVDVPSRMTDSSVTTQASRVQFALDDQVKVMTPTQFEFATDEDLPQRPISPALSTASTASSDDAATSPVAKTIADRLSFWSRISKRGIPLPPILSNGNAITDDGLPPTPTSPLGSVVEPEVLDQIIREGKEEPSEVLGSILSATAPAPISPEERHSELEVKIVRECIREYTKGGMYFAYHFDITRSLQHKQELALKARKQQALLADLNAVSETNLPDENRVSKGLYEPQPTLPLWRRVDKQYWWNEWLSKPFVDAGRHSYVLPIMQGFCQVATFPVQEDETFAEDGNVSTADYVVVSRRSRDRAGLRYQRRGIDDEAYVANFVETETIMHVEREGKSNVFSYVQIRGSIPLFWNQSGYALKPPPVLATDRTRKQNLEALRRHFGRTVPQYGPHTIVNLAEHIGKEGVITKCYREYIKELDLKDVRYHEYDFHRETKGMKYEKISSLVEAMGRVFDNQGYFWVSGGDILSEQHGVFRVNCIDCLDRTNVVQSAFARAILNKQLGAVALIGPSIEERPEINWVFNDVWANNGDAISRSYAGTSALKGDFTRTGKRDLSGMLNDGVNSLARMYTATFSDWFSQAVIDFMLGNRTVSVFSEFLLKLQSSDPSDLIRLSKIRAEAIATCVSRVLEEGQRLLSGWTLFSPEELNLKIGDKFEEKVLLLTAQAIYIISYDYTLEKVKMYTRVPLGDILGISKGAYILSPLEEASRDPVQNAGFVISWTNSHNQITRVTSYSVRNSLETKSPQLSRTSASSASVASVTRRPLALSLSRRGTRLSKILSDVSLASNSERTFAAFKILPIDPARVRRGPSSGGIYAETSDELTGASNCREAVDMIVDSIRRACEDIGNTRADFVSEEDVVSLAEAQRMTTMYAKMEYGVKRLLWLGG